AGDHVRAEPAMPTAGRVRVQTERDLEREREEAEAARRREMELKKADAAVALAEAHEKLARDAWERAHDALLEARRARDAVKKTVKTKLRLATRKSPPSPAIESPRASCRSLARRPSGSRSRSARRCRRSRASGSADRRAPPPFRTARRAPRR